MSITKKTVKSIHKKLTDQGYLCDQAFAYKIASTLGNKPTSGGFLFGPAGTGKSFLPQAIANFLGAEHIFYQCFPGTREDDLLVKMLPDETTTSGIKLYDGPVLKAIHTSLNGDGTKPIVLTLDEWDKTRPSADSFLLDFLQNGRVTFQGEEHVADLSRLFVYVTMNDERDLSEPLLRRLPMIVFDHLPAELVYEALQSTHAESSHIGAAIMLYQRCVMSGMSKPATIQELRQLLDAIDLLGKNADWDSLVFQYVTKTEENHMLLKMQEDKDVDFHPDDDEEPDDDDDDEQNVGDKLNAEKYNVNKDDLENLNGKRSKARKAAMPAMIDLREFDIDWEGKPVVDDAKTYGVMKRTTKEYNRIVHMIRQPNDHAGELGSFDMDDIVANVSEDDIRLTKPIPLIHSHKVKDIFKGEGEVMFLEPLATLEDIRTLSKRSNEELQIVKYCNEEVIARAPGIHLRCTPGEGAEIIVDLLFEMEFDQIFSSWLHGNKNVDDLEGSVIVSPDKYGLMLQKHYLRGLKGYNKALIKNRYDIWGDGWDTIDTKDIPLLEEFLQEDYTVLDSKRAEDKFYLADNIVFGFFGKDNDMFGVKILGRFEEKYFKYLQAWMPDEGAEVRFDETIETTLTEEELLKKEHGYQYTKGSKDTLYKKMPSGIRVNFLPAINKLKMIGDIPKNKMTYKKITSILQDMESTWEVFYGK